MFRKSFTLISARVEQFWMNVVEENCFEMKSKLLSYIGFNTEGNKDSIDY